MPFHCEIVPSIVESIATPLAESTAETSPTLLSLLKLLVHKSANVNEVQEETGITPLAAVAKTTRFTPQDILESLAFLVEQGANINNIVVPVTEHLEVIDFFITNGAILNTDSLAGKVKSLEVVKFLVKKLQEVDAPKFLHGGLPIETFKFLVEEKGLDPIETFATAESLDVVKYLLEKKIPYSRKVTKSHLRNLEVTKFLVEELKFNVNGVNTWGESLLHQTGNQAVARYLISKGLDVNKPNRAGWTSLHTATHDGAPLEYLKFLVKMGADPKAIDKKGQLPLHLCNDLAVVIWYTITFGISLEVEDSNGETLLFKTKSHHVTKYLLREGVKYTIRDLEEAVKNQRYHKVVCFRMQDSLRVSENSIVMHLAEDPRLLKLFKNEKINVDARDEAGRTALHCAVKSQNIEKLNMLIEKNYNINAVDSMGRTALHYACKSGLTETAKILLSRGANLEIVDSRGDIALHYATNAEISIAIIKKMARRW